MSNLTTTNQKSLAKREAKETFSIFMERDAVKNLINTSIGKNSQRFITSIISAVSTNPQLQECNHFSILSSALLGESLGLSPSPQLGHYYMVPFKKKGKNGEPDTSVATFVLGYKGYIQLAIRSGFYKKLNVIAIKDGELVSYNPLTEELEINLIEDEEQRENATTIGYYAMFEYTNGFQKSLYWSKKKMLMHADKYSQAFSKSAYEDLQAGKISEKDMWKYSSFWYKDFDGMAYKTMLRQLISKWGIMSIEMQKAFESDDAVIGKNGEVEFVSTPSLDENEIAERIEIQNEQIKQGSSAPEVDFFDDVASEE